MDEQPPVPFTESMDVYSMRQADKEMWLLKGMRKLTAWHQERCTEYARFLYGSRVSLDDVEQIEQLPYLPTSIFKRFELKSVADVDIPKLKSVQSSSTSSGVPSRIFVDESTSIRQKKSVQLIFDSYLGTRRRPYIIFDAMETARGKNSMSARGAAIMSLMGYASKFYFVMDIQDGQLVLNEERLSEAVQAAKAAGDFIAYGFTYILYQAHEKLQGMSLSFEGFGNQTFLIHSGGWKKLQSLAVDKEIFNQTISSVWTVSPNQVIDFYGLVEQTGVIYPDCPYGNKHVPYYADVIIREPHTLQTLQPGETGLLQLMNLLPLAGPNHSVITDDLGKIIHIDDCPCGRKGKAFRFNGRAPKAEIRGCGDVYAEESL
ncbi:phenylacetate-coenzyme A ligase PaaK-like adenylate-forming protein [Paenibacillus forsythiae]|uniref:Phenylacetate-coenzyme A ligase PaaK-like adenylate-forming protein n=1 Tax=Paenibacillus forsythiae TaxID=365616 RepID=A0ABU3HB06_9BACL|nr:hypothetical protein [Paenibacillus forsythiae]MDT3427994.1 phenylacetate-coenzyme A ligase PaaK-like adenylate-forming protein [Paenibacillus forsythiae]